MAIALPHPPPPLLKEKKNQCLFCMYDKERVWEVMKVETYQSFQLFFATIHGSYYTFQYYSQVLLYYLASFQGVFFFKYFFIVLSAKNFQFQLNKLFPNRRSIQGLQSLNLSFNILTGGIPQNIGDMRSLESIDFSEYQLFVKFLKVCQV